MKKVWKKIREIDWTKGSGEFVSFAWIAPLICFLIIIICTFIKLSSGMHEITNALDAAGRSAAVCVNYDDAILQSQLVAESAITDPSIHDIQIDIDFPTGDTEWKPGLIIKVTISARVETVLYSFTPVFTGNKSDKRIVKSMIYTVEGASYDSDDLFLMANIMWHEAGVGGYQGMLAIGTAVMNRVENSTYYPNTIAENFYKPGQMYDCYLPSIQAEVNLWIQHPEFIPQEAVECARDVMAGTRTSVLMDTRGSGHPCYSWHTYGYDGFENSHPNGVNVGGNWFHWYW